jgi:hypothetical protein
MRGVRARIAPPGRASARSRGELQSVACPPCCFEAVQHLPRRTGAVANHVHGRSLATRAQARAGTVKDACYSGLPPMCPCVPPCHRIRMADTPPTVAQQHQPGTRDSPPRVTHRSAAGLLLELGPFSRQPAARRPDRQRPAGFAGRFRMQSQVGDRGTPDSVSTFALFGVSGDGVRACRRG